MSRDHFCDDRCVCLLHDPPLPLFYSRPTGEHACQDPECEHAHRFNWLAYYGGLSRQRELLGGPFRSSPFTMMEPQ